MKKMKFKWGQWVTASAVVKKSAEGTYPAPPKRILRRVKKSVVGRIVGVAYRQEGNITPNNDGEWGHLDATRTVRLYRVAITWRNQVLCFEDDLTAAAVVFGQELPFQTAYKMTEKEKAEIRKAPRDASGRFA
ncbi:MAG: hypothetical protein ABH877_04270 [bacterium]